MKIDIVLPGTHVKYHGSLAQYHGEMTVYDFASPIKRLHAGDVIRYRLKYGPGWADFLSNVRPESFTVINKTES